MSHQPPGDSHQFLKSNSKQSSDSQEQIRALLSIKPEFVASILSGKKKFEYRRTIFGKKVDVVVVYASAPISKVIGEFDVVSVMSDDLSRLWKGTAAKAGIKKEYYDRYFAGKSIGNAIQIGEVREYDSPFCPNEVFGLKPPQSFAYIRS